MKIEVNGEPYINFTSAMVEMSLDSLARSFRFTAIDPNGEGPPFKNGDTCKFFVEDELVLTGFIEVIEISYSSDEHHISVSGRSKTCDLIDSTLPAKDYNTPVKLKSVIEEVMGEKGLNLKGIEVKVASGTEIDDFKKGEDKIASSLGENAFSFVERLARKRQVLLTSDPDGNIVIISPDPETIDHKLIHVIPEGGPLSFLDKSKNNILSANSTRNDTKRYNKYFVKSQDNYSEVFNKGTLDLEKGVDQTNDATDGDIREGRQLVIVAEESSVKKQLGLRATWEGNIRRARSKLYTAVVIGFKTESDKIWEINKLVNIDDKAAGIDPKKKMDDELGPEMLINSIKFTLDSDGGSKTTLGFVPKDAYKVILKEPEKSVEDDSPFED